MQLLIFLDVRVLFNWYPLRRLIFGLGIIFFTLNSYGTTISEDEIKELAARVNSQIAGVELFGGVVGRKVISIGRQIIHQYDVPEDWQPFPDAKLAIISEAKNSGMADYYFNQRINVSYAYFKKNSAPIWIRVKSREYSPINFELGQYTSIKGHPKSKGIDFKIRPPKDWLVQEGNGPNVVRKFTYKNYGFTIVTKHMPTFMSRSKAKATLSDDSFIGELTGELCPSIKRKSEDLVTIASYPAVRASFLCPQELNGIKIDMFMVSWLIFLEDKVVILGGVGFNEIEFQELKKLYSLVAVSSSFPERFN